MKKEPGCPGLKCTFERDKAMDNRPIGREKKTISGTANVKRNGPGLGRTTSQRNVKRESLPGTDKKKSSSGGLFQK